MRGGRIAVVGGSIAGCSAALAASRQGADEVVVFERAADELSDRGVGLAFHGDRYVELRSAGLVDDDIPTVPQQRRLWIVRDGDAARGRVFAQHEFTFRTYNWGSLYRELRDRIPAEVDYRSGTAVAEVVDGPDGAVVRLADGSEERFDLVIGADGYRSVTRTAIGPDAAAQFSGYVAFRGTFPFERLAELKDMIEPGQEWLESDSLTIGFPDGHVIAYPIPGPDGGIIANWLFYTAVPAELDLGLQSPTSLPPGSVADSLFDYLYEQMEAKLPPFFNAALRMTPREKAFIQPIYDFAVPTYIGERVLLLGDSATVARPHLGAGAVKALQDTAVLEATWGEAESWKELLQRYDAARRPGGHAMVAVARQLGQAMVLETPDWAGFDQAGFDAWWVALTALPNGANIFGGGDLKK